MQRTRLSASTRLVHLAISFFFAALLLFLWCANMQKPLDHDEHMYVAAGALFGREGALPYRDYPYFQMPLLPAVYAVALSLGSYKLLIARTFSTLCELGTSGVLFYAGWRAVREQTPIVRFLVGSAACLLFVANPLTYHAGGLAWNHDLPLFAGIASFGILLFGSERRGSIFLGGLLLGIAISTRLAFALLLIPTVGGVLLRTGMAGAQQRRDAAVWLPAGLVTGLLPAILLFPASPNAFVFDNLTYHGINMLYREGTGYTHAMDAPGKLRYALEVAGEPATLALIALIAAGWTAIAFRRRKAAAGSLWAPLVGLASVGAVAISALVPTPVWYQYFYAAVPFLVLEATLLLGAVSHGAITRIKLGVLAVAAAPAILYSWDSYSGLDTARSFSSWTVIGVHNTGQRIAQEAGPGKVLTLSPLYPLEGGAAICPELAPGVFGWRNAPFLSAADREKYRIVGAANLEATCAADPPAAILTGGEPGLETALEDYARNKGYVPSSLGNGLTLWLREGRR